MLLIAFLLSLFIFQGSHAGRTMPLAINRPNIPLVSEAPFENIWLFVLELNEDGSILNPPTLCMTGDTSPGCAEKRQDGYPSQPNPIYINVEVDYLKDVLPHEMNVAENDPTPAALQAQAIASRTFVNWAAVNNP